MHYSAWLLALYIQSASAFYPVDLSSKLASEGGEKASTKRFFPVLAESAFADDDAKAVTVSYSKRVARGVKNRRANAYTVRNSTEPSLSNSAPLDEDVDDYSYFPVVQVGSSKKEMYMLIDSGSANTWMFGASCTSKSCLAHNTFGKADSKTLVASTETWSVVYGSGSVSGVLATDTWSLAGFDVSMEFGLASTATDQFMEYPLDGILGLGRPDSNQMGTKTFMEVLADKDLLKSNLFGINLQRAADGALDGEINFGVVDTTKFSGSLTYSDLIGTDYWEIDVDDASVGGKACGMMGRTAVFDTGTSFVILPPGDAAILHAKVSGAVQYGQYFNIPCKTDATIAFTFSGVSYTISPKDYVGDTNSTSGLCVSNILAHTALSASQWLIGDTFLKNVYTVFDVDGSRLGLASRGKGTASTATSTKSSTKSSATGGSISTGSSSSSSTTDSASSSWSTSTARDGHSSTSSSSLSTVSSSATGAINTSEGAASSLAFGDPWVNFLCCVVITVVFS